MPAKIFSFIAMEYCIFITIFKVETSSGGEKLSIRFFELPAVTLVCLLPYMDVRGLGGSPSPQAIRKNVEGVEFPKKLRFVGIFSIKLAVFYVVEHFVKNIPKKLVSEFCSRTCIVVTVNTISNLYYLQ